MSLVQTFCQSQMRTQFYTANPFVPEWVKPQIHFYKMTEIGTFIRSSGPIDSDVIEVFQGDIDETAVCRSMEEIDQLGGYTEANMFGYVELRSVHFMKFSSRIILDPYDVSHCYVQVLEIHTFLSETQLCGRSVLQKNRYKIQFHEGEENSPLMDKIQKMQTVYFFLLAQRRGEMKFGDASFQLSELPDPVTCRIVEYLIG